MAVREVAVADHFDALMPMMRDNWAETGFGWECSPSRERYVALLEAGILLALVATGRDDEVIGYCTAMVVAHPFNLAVIYCASDALYVKPEYRKGIVPGRLMKATERRAKARGARMISWHTRAGTALADTMIRHGYRPGDMVVHKEL